MLRAARAAIAAAVLATVTGCAACREHPVMCAASIVVTGAVAAKALEQPTRTTSAARSCFNLSADACR